ncbi:MAG: ParA family protein [Deltaproteobacteria bacterium]|nr:ParA family protein [Deltaproteobacteria bacterium]
MDRLLAIANQKGGVGKTTTAINLAASLAHLGHRCLLVDLDPQGNATSGLGLPREGDSIYQALIGKREIKELIRPTGVPNLEVIPSQIELIGAEVELVSLWARESRLASAVVDVVSQYAFVLIDCPPSLGLLTVNALTAAHGVIIPLQCEFYALEGLAQLLRTIKLVKARLNPRLEVVGLLLTMFDPRTTLCHQVEREVRGRFGDKTFRTVIPRNVRLGEAPSFGKPVLVYDPTCRGATSYLDLARELLDREGGHRG